MRDDYAALSPADHHYLLVLREAGAADWSKRES
jgi:hypothetical protein